MPDGRHVEVVDGSFGLIWQLWQDNVLMDTYCPWNGDPRPDWVGELERDIMSEPDTICDMCFPDVTYVGNATQMLVVGHDSNGYILFVEPCHNGDDLVRFVDDPAVDPVPADDEEADAAFEVDKTLPTRSDLWLATAREAMTGMCPTDLRWAWRMVEDLRVAGYDPEEHGDAELWLYEQVARVIEATKNV